ncbi:MAG TPA: hypothetical protein VFR65_01465 [Nitrososphaeraceae archaeon]|jgi:hypothetical protein|nr:hypothetical protein [Nitrososphaeraceae archaeon]
MYNNFNNINSSSYDVLPRQFLNYIDYELSCFEKITNKKFLFNISKNEKFELNVYQSKKEEEEADDKDKSKYQIIYRANNLYQFIKRLLMIREYLIKHFDNKTTKKPIVL